MSFRTNNLECTGCDFFEYEVFYRTSEGPPNCPECGSKREMSFKGLTRAQKADRLDTMRHNSFKRKKARGCDDQMLKEVSAQNKRYKAEGRTQPKPPPPESK